MPERHDEADLLRLAAVVDRWAEHEAASNALLLAVDHDPALRRWYVRLQGEDKEYITVWLTLRERTLHHETYFMPAPEENVEATYEYLLRANHRLYGMAFSIGDEDAVYLRGQVPLDALDEDELDRIVGSSWEWSERHFRTAMRLGYASRFTERR